MTSPDHEENAVAGVATAQTAIEQRLSSLEQSVQQALRKLLERDASHLTWTKETAKLISSIRDELHLEHLTWLKETAQIVSRLRDETLHRLNGFDQRLIADLRDRIDLQAREVERRHELDLKTALLVEDLQRLLPEPASGKRRAATPHPVTDQASPSDRSFGLLKPCVDQALEGLLSLSPWVADDLTTSVYLSRLANDALRTLYPPNEHRLAPILCRSGLQLEADMSDIFAANAAFGWLQEADDFALFMALVTPGATVIDVGANFGLYAAHAALYAGPEGRVVAFEPGPEAYGLLVANMARNELADRCLCVQAAVADQPGTAGFNVAADSAFSGLRDTGRSESLGVVQTEVVALDTLPALQDLPAIDLIKIDVEGGEGAVLAGARHIFERSPDLVAMMEFSHKNLDETGRQGVMAELTKLDAAGFCIMARQRHGLVTIKLEALNQERSENLFLCRRGGARMHRLRELASSTPPRKITPSEAAAVALLRRQAAGLVPGVATSPSDPM